MCVWLHRVPGAINYYTCGCVPLDDIIITQNIKYGRQVHSFVNNTSGIRGVFQVQNACD